MDGQEGERAIRSPGSPSGKSARKGAGQTFRGVDYFGSTRDELYSRARDLGVAGRSKMDKKELAEAIARKQG